MLEPGARRMGIASHLGLWLQRPTVGCGKTRLCGRHEPLPEERDTCAPWIEAELAGLPVLFFFTGPHADYHRPSDDTERINFAGMARIA